MTRMYSQRWTRLLEQLENGLLLITASNRQAKFIRQQYRYYNQAKQQQSKVWYKPAIYTNRQWTQTIFRDLMFYLDECQPPFVLLSELQTKLLWEKAVESEADFLLDNKKTAARACQAASNLHNWLLADLIEQDDSFSWRKETAKFRKWHQLVEKQCNDNHWLPSYKIDTYLSKHIHLLFNKNNASLLPQTIGMLGFQQLSPAKKQLLAELKSIGTEFITLHPDLQENQIHRLEYNNSTEEILASAYWAKQQWQQDQKLRIAVIIPNLSEKRRLVQHTFDQVFCSERLLDNNDNIDQPFDISLGNSLGSYPVIDCVLTLMSLTTSSLTQNEIVQLIQSPFLINQDQQQMVNDVIIKIRQSRLASFKLAELTFIASKSVPENTTSELLSLFSTLTDFKISKKATPGHWAQKWYEFLQAINWSEKRQLSSVEFQTREAWNNNIEQMTHFDQLLGEISWSAFRKLFKRIIAETLFQPKTADLSIQIMGILEAVSLTFDKVRVCGLDNRLWPARSNPNPFIPFDIQRQHQTPNATAERELEISEQLLQSLECSAKQVIFSHPVMDGEQSLNVSPLLEKYPAERVANNNSFLSPAKQISAAPKATILIDDDKACALKQAEVRGGSKLLQDIAKCQFRAFAHHRLYANAVDEAREGIDPLDRGNLVHAILESCWLHLFKNKQQHLLELTEQEKLPSAIEPYISAALTQLQKDRPTPLSQAVIDLEKRRLKRLLLEWLQMELQREEFTVIANEKKIDAPIAAHVIKLQIDRIDKLPDGSLAIIDYKTGQVDRNNWFGSRPQEPQLPLYATVLADQNCTIGALLYGQVKTGGCQFTGVIRDKEQLSMLHKNFDAEALLNPDARSLNEQIYIWRKNLTSLLDEYVHGHSAVSPKDDKVCAYCDLHGFCRIGEMSQRQPESKS